MCAFAKEKNAASFFRASGKTFCKNENNINIELHAIGIDKNNTNIKLRTIDIDKNNINIELRTIDIDKYNINIELRTIDIDKNNIKVRKSLIYHACPEKGKKTDLSAGWPGAVDRADSAGSRRPRGWILRQKEVIYR